MSRGSSPSARPSASASPSGMCVRMAPSGLRAVAEVALAQEGVVDLDVLMGAARAAQGPAGAAHRGHELPAGGGRQPDRVGDLLDRVAGAVKRGDGLLGSQTDRKLGGGHPRLLSSMWVVGTGWG